MCDYNSVHTKIDITDFSCCLFNFWVLSHTRDVSYAAQSTFSVFLNDQSVLPLTTNFCWYHINAPGQVISLSSLLLSLPPFSPLSLSLSLPLSWSLYPFLSSHPLSLLYFLSLPLSLPPHFMACMCTAHVAFIRFTSRTYRSFFFVSLLGQSLPCTYTLDLQEPCAEKLPLDYVYVQHPLISVTTLSLWSFIRT